MSELGDKRELFTWGIFKLLEFMYSKKQRPRFDKEHSNHIKGSLHYLGLAKDVLLFDEFNTYKDKTEDHREFGLYWESLHPDFYWGGDGLKEDGLKNDGNHYSCTFEGKK